MNLKTDYLTEKHAKEICTWKYEGIYSVYNMPDWDILKESKVGITIPEIRRKEFLGVFDDSNNLCGYLRIRPKDNCVMIGVGLKPELTGKGIGKKLMRIIIKESNKRYPNKNIRLTVRKFNQRAIKCYESSGFKTTKEIQKDTLSGKDTFVEMEYSINNEN